jgi:hypothetical protein
MKKYLIGLLSVFLLFASILGATSRRPKAPRTGRDAGPTMWV